MSKAKPLRRALRFEDWNDVLADVDALHSQGYDRAGNLSLGQICSHLAAVLDSAVDGSPSTMPWPIQKLLRVFVLGKMLKHKPTRLRVRAPAFADPTPPVDDEAGIERLRAAIARFSAADVEYHEHVAFGKLNPEQWKHQQLWHCEHHLSFLRPRGASPVSQ